MRKNLLLLLLFCVCTMVKAQNEPVITLTAGAVESGGVEGLIFHFNTKVQGTKLMIDWGDGSKVETPAIDVMDDYGTHTPVEGVPVGTREIKIYGEGITYFDCSYDKTKPTKIVALDVTKATGLVTLELVSNSISTLDLGKNVTLTNLNCSGNQFESIDLSANVNLKAVLFNDNTLTTIDLSKSPALTELRINNNKVKILDLSNCTDLKSLYALNNELTSVNLATQNEKAYISLNNNKLESLDLTKCGKVTTVFCIGNLLKNIKVGPIVTTLNCSANYLTFATIPTTTGAKNLIYQPQKPMAMNANYFIGEKVNLSSFDNVQGMAAAPQTATFVWKTEAGVTLVEGTDYSVNKAVFEFLKPQTDKVYCEISSQAFPNFKTTNIFKTAPFKVQADYTEPVIALTAGAVAESGTEGMTLNFNTAIEGTKLQIDWGNGTKVITAPGVLIDEYAASTAVDGVPSGNREIKIYGEGITSFDYSYDKNKPTKIVALDVTKATDLKRLSVATSSLSALDLKKNVALTNLDCSANKFESIDLSANVNLEVVLFNDNTLTAIDLSRSPALNELRINNNKVETLDLSNCTDLKSLYALNNVLTSVKLATQNEKAFINVNNNKLKSLDLLACGKITTLFCMSNLLTDIKVGQIITTFNCSKNNLTLATIPAETGVKSLTYAPQANMEIQAEINMDGELDLSAQTDLKGLATEKKATVFTWKKADGTALVADTDYTENEGVFKFLKVFDAVYCEMTTDAFPKFTGANVFKTTNVKVKTGTSIDNSALGNVIVYSESGKLFIEGLKGAEAVNVFNLQGINVASTVANDAVVAFPLNAGQYIIMIDNVARKAVVR